MLCRLFNELKSLESNVGFLIWSKTPSFHFIKMRSPWGNGPLESRCLLLVVEKSVETWVRLSEETKWAGGVVKVGRTNESLKGRLTEQYWGWLAHRRWPRTLPDLSNCIESMKEKNNVKNKLTDQTTKEW